MPDVKQVPGASGAADLSQSPGPASSPQDPMMTPAPTGMEGIRVPPLQQPDPMPRPPWLDAERQNMADANTKIRDENFAKIKVMQENGGNIAGQRILELKLEALLDMMFDRHTRRGQDQYLRWERRFEELIAYELDQIIPQIDHIKGYVASQVRQKMLKGEITPELLQMAKSLGVPIPGAEAFAKSLRAEGQ